MRDLTVEHPTGHARTPQERGDKQDPAPRECPVFPRIRVTKARPAVAPAARRRARIPSGRNRTEATAARARCVGTVPVRRARPDRCVPFRENRVASARPHAPAARPAAPKATTNPTGRPAAREWTVNPARAGPAWKAIPARRRIPATKARSLVGGATSSASTPG